MVDWQMVWPWPWHLRNVSASPRVHCENRGNVAVVIGFLAWPHSLDHLDTTDFDTLFRQVTLDDAL